MATLARLDDYRHVDDDEDEMEDLPTEREGEGAGKKVDETAPEWLNLANTAFDQSDNYMRGSLAKDWERNLRLWQSRHPSGSKYLSGDYAQRSKVFRPKTRSAMRRREAAAANALFATAEVVVVEAEDDSDDLQRAAAALAKQLLNYRLTKTIPWFMTSMGAHQTANIFGLCCSRQAWLFEEKDLGDTLVPVLDEMGMQAIDDAGRPRFEKRKNLQTVSDRPDIQLMPPENIRIDYGANWIDQAQASPFFIALHPMYVVDVRARMKALDSKTGAPRWKEYDAEQIRAARNEMHDSIRKARHQDRQDPATDTERALGDYDIVYVREVFLRREDGDFTFWTLGSQGLLTDPKKTEDVFWYLNRRPYRIGVAQLEAHQAVPEGAVALGAELQGLANQIVNDRNDNVRLALQARYFVRAGGNVDMESLRRNVPGASTMMSNPETDVRVERAPDVTQSAYAEQDRANVDYDELIGHFSTGTVQSERNLNETVGGMNMLNNAVNSVQDFDIRVWIETWVEPVLRDLLKMEQALEDDPAVLKIAGKRAQLWQAYQISEVTDELLEKEVNLSVNVGLGATDPMQRLQKFQMAAQTVGMALGPQIQQMLNAQEIVNEVFGILGYRSAERFFNFERGEDPQVAQLKQENAQLKQELESGLATERMKQETKMREIAAESAATAAELRSEMRLTAAELQQKYSADANKTLVAVLQMLQGQAQHHDQMASGMHDRALTARDQNLGADSERAKRLADAASRADGERKAKEKAEADEKKQASQSSEFKELLRELMNHNTQTLEGALARVSEAITAQRAPAATGGD